MKALVLYDSMGGNTQKVAEGIATVARSAQIQTTSIKLSDSTDFDFFDYYLVCIGSPVIEWLPTKPMMEFLKKKLKDYRLSGDIPPAIVPARADKFAICFGTNCGAHIGVDEASPMTEWMAAFLGHIGFQVLDKIHIPGEMRDFGQGSDWMTKETFEKINTLGVYGNIKGRPDENDLANLKQRVTGLISKLPRLNDSSA